LLPEIFFTQKGQFFESKEIRTSLSCTSIEEIPYVLEERIQEWAGQEDNSWVITATVFDKDGITGRDKDDDAWRMKCLDGRRVAIPSVLYKIVICPAQDDWETLTILIPI